MRQIARRLKDGSLQLVEVPEVRPGEHQVTVRVSASVISAGTERATMEAARKNLLAKARARPDQARQVLDRVLTEGPRETWAFIRRRLDELGPLGYSAAGTVMTAGDGVTRIKPGSRVAIAGGGFANHAELDIVPELLCARVPDRVTDEDAAFATVGAVALHGFRRSEAQVGEKIAVIGLGLIGQLVTRIALGAGCSVHGVDLDQRLVELAASAGAAAYPRDDPRAELDTGVDAVLICASSNSNDPIELAGRLARDRAPVVAVGAVRMEVPRGPFYEKELDLRISRSYGPGRYDPAYELHGRDYPPAYVRWTEQRNMDAFLQLVAMGKVRPSELVTHRFDFSDAERAYEVLQNQRATAIVLSYPGPTGNAVEPRRRVAPRRAPQRGRFGLIGAGSFAIGKIIPGLIAAGLEPGVVASASGLSAESARQRFGFEATAASSQAVISDESVHLVVIATPHVMHADLVVAALERDRDVYVEKPLALEFDQLGRIERALLPSSGRLFVGFNRRHSRLAGELRALGGPRLMHYRVNAGRLAVDHWTNDLKRGGGRLKGEGCHFIDFVCDQVEADPVIVSCSGFRSHPSLPLVATDNFSVRIEFVDGSTGTIAYSADAPTGPGKERFETSAPGAYAVIDDFRRGSIWSAGKRRSLGSRTQDKGFKAQFELIAAVLAGRAEPPSAETYLLSSLTTLAAARSLASGDPESVTAPTF